MTEKKIGFFFSELKGLEVGILYNNVGVSYDHAELLHELSDEKIQVHPKPDTLNPKP